MTMLRLFQRILNLSGKYRGRINAAFLCTFSEAVLAKMPLFFAVYVLSGILNGTLTVTGCVLVGAGMLCCVLLQAFFHHGSDRLQSTAGYMMFADKRMELGNHLRKLPMGYFAAGNIGNISSVLSTDMVFIEETAMSTIANMMNYLFSQVLLVLFMFWLNPTLGGIAFLVCVLSSLIAERMNRMSLSESAGRQEQSRKLTDAVLSFLEGIGVIKSYNLLSEKGGELTAAFAASRDTAIGFEKKLTPWTIGLELIYALGMAAVFYTAFSLYGNDVLPLPYLIGVCLFAFDLFSPMKALYGEATRLTVTEAALDRLEQMLAEPELPEPSGEKVFPGCGRKQEQERETTAGMRKTEALLGKKSQNACAGTDACAPRTGELEKPQPSPSISFQNVSFGYGEREVLHSLSFDMPAHTMTALIGPSGGGKTTVANLLARFWDVEQGAIYLGGKDIRKYPLSELMAQISMVFQRVYLFKDSIYNNILMGNPNASREEVYEAAGKARCLEFIEHLPDGFDTMVGEGGATLSGGEKQRISIARCILKNAPVIILDEMTASVDLDNERYIQEAITEMVKGKTLLCIAHRLNTIEAADQVLRIEGGRITAQGTPAEVLGLKRSY